MNLGKNINSLLRRYAEVYVPGIGVFKRIHSPAQFDKQNNVFLPPISYVELDYSAQHGFNMVHYIQQQENLGLGQAQQIVDEAVAALRDELGQFGQAKLDDLGLLISYGTSLVFKPLDLSGFNFQPVVNLAGPDIETVIPALEEEHVASTDTQDGERDVEPESTESEDTGIDPQPLTAEGNAEVAEQSPAADDDAVAESDEPADVIVETATTEPAVVELEDSVAQQANDTTGELRKEQGAIATANAAYTPNIYEEEPRNSNAIWYWLTAAIVLVMLVVGVLYTNPGLKHTLLGGPTPAKATVDSIGQKRNATVLDSASQVLATDSLRQTDSLVSTAADSAKAATGTVSASKTVDKPTVLQADPVIKESIPLAQPKYQLVIGSAKTMVQAEQEAKRLREMGYKTARAVEGKTKKSRKKVILNAYMTKEEADLARKSVEKKIKDAWVETL
ncbi:SPOR domain-containing protein [Sphingobacterium thalpophilum]|uniref:HU domain-containing protein n=1 Tax=Sphingobacterium thalpophilum TaxID=259 RepID=UPI003D9904F2